MRTFESVVKKGKGNKGKSTLLSDTKSEVNLCKYY